MGSQDPHLTKVTKVLLSLLFSSVAAERLFSQLKLVKTDNIKDVFIYYPVY